jgi:hypothetical protein
MSALWGLLLNQMGSNLTCMDLKGQSTSLRSVGLEDQKVGFVSKKWLWSQRNLNLEHVQTSLNDLKQVSGRPLRDFDLCWRSLKPKFWTWKLTGNLSVNLTRKNESVFDHSEVKQPTSRVLEGLASALASVWHMPDLCWRSLGPKLGKESGKNGRKPKFDMEIDWKFDLTWNLTWNLTKIWPKSENESVLWSSEDPNGSNDHFWMPGRLGNGPGKSKLDKESENFEQELWKTGRFSGLLRPKKLEFGVGTDLKWPPRVPGGLWVLKNFEFGHEILKKRTKGHFWTKPYMKTGPKFGLKMVRKDPKMTQMDWKLLWGDLERLRVP